MRRADRLFDIIQLLRGSRRPLTAAALASELEVTVRTVYRDEARNRTTRIVWPLAMAYYTDVTLIGIWCELRRDYRDLRLERILASELLDERFPADDGRMMAEWMALRKEWRDAVPA
jgi:predicted DNA-binding transcriptional regulator YafY